MLDRQMSIGVGLQVVVVDDGSDDDSLQLLHQFRHRWPNQVDVMSQRTGGLASARNAGLELVQGEWVTFTDPDDLVSEDYFSAVSDAIDSLARPEVSVFATNVRLSDGQRDSIVHNDVLRHRFSHGARVIDLAGEPDALQLGARNAFIRRTTIVEHGLTFDVRSIPGHEDSHFLTTVLARGGSAQLAVVPDALYYLRRKRETSSLIDTPGSANGCLTRVPGLGLMEIVDDALAVTAELPRWLQNAILHEVNGILRLVTASRFTAAEDWSDAEQEKFHAVMTTLMAHVDRDALHSFTLAPMSDDVRFLLECYRPDGSWVSPSVVLSRVDRPLGLVELRYRFKAGHQPQEAFYGGGGWVHPRHSTTRTVRVAGQHVWSERILWLPRSTPLRVFLNGKIAAIDNGDAVPRTEVITNSTVMRKLSSALGSRPRPYQARDQSVVDRVKSWGSRHISMLSATRLTHSLQASVASTAFHSGWAKRRYAQAWVFLDKPDAGGDNAEHLYRWVRAHHPTVNAWFVLERSSSDWSRLRREGFRLVPYGSRRWKLLMMHACHLASSHVDAHIVNPLNRRVYGPPRWRYTFLQHGVILHDLSRWLNTKSVDLFITTTAAEHASIVNDESPYAFTSKEVQLLGLPRYDLLASRRASVPIEQRRTVLVIPTWRKYLTLPGENAYRRRAIADFETSDYAQAYLGLLNSAELRSFAESRGYEIVFAPHPNMTPYVDFFASKTTATVRPFVAHEFQDLLARASVLVTDYSSIAFDAAYADVPVVYFQFDRTTMLGGAHIWGPGYYDYQNDGFGPVAESVAGVVDAVTTLAGPSLSGVFRERAEGTFAYRDASNCARVFDAMSALPIEKLASR